MTSLTSGMIVDIIEKQIYPGTLIVENGKIIKIEKTTEPLSPYFILPGFVDAHVHVESSMLVPSEFAKLAVVHGTVGSVSDPHEIANVLGIAGVRFMIDNGKKVPFNFYFGAPSCVPATSFETSGALLSSEDIAQLFKEDQLRYLSEMMNFPGVLAKDPEVLKKIAIAQSLNLPIDGHAPGLRGKDIQEYIQAGISTDHECVSLDEALEKIKYGMKILIREGSAAKNFEQLHPLLGLHPDKTMFCSDDKHPHDLVKSHINDLVIRSVHLNYDLMHVLRAASLNPVMNYRLDIGLLRPGDQADFIIANNLRDFKIIKTYITGRLVSQEGVSLISSVHVNPVNQFECTPKQVKDFEIQALSSKIHVIQAINDQLTTTGDIFEAKIENNKMVVDLERDLLKIAVVNRYQDLQPFLGFIQNFGFKRGAIASCIAHDSHNIIAVGCSDEEICRAVNLVINNKGGIALVDASKEMDLPLPVAGIMSHEEGYAVAKKYAALENYSKTMGTTLRDPFMTLSFMALLVIPKLKISDQGLFDGGEFRPISLYV